MGKQSVLAYSIAGIAVAVAIIAVAASSLGLADASGDTSAQTVVVGQPVGTGSGDAVALPDGSLTADGVEYVYVDEPSPLGYDDDDHDDDEGDEHEDRSGIFGWLTGKDHDDDD